jgi:hypothetical protein
MIMAGEERVFAIEHDGADATLDDIGVELDAAVVKEAGKPVPVVQAVADLLSNFGLGETRASWCSNQVLSDATRGLRLSWRTRRRSSALIPRIVFSIA